MVADRHVRSGRAVKGLYLRFAHVLNRHATLAAVRMVGDLGAFDSQDLADQRMKNRRRSARLSREDFGERIALLGRGARIEIQRGAPVPLVHRARRTEERGYVEAIKGSIPELTRTDMPSYQHRAISLGRRAQKNTWTQSLTVAGFEVIALRLPFESHRNLLR